MDTVGLRERIIGAIATLCAPEPARARPGEVPVRSMPHPILLCRLLAAIALTIGTWVSHPAALAQSSEARIPEHPAGAPGAPDWRFEIKPVAWYVAPGGDLRLPGNAVDGGGEQHNLSELNLDSPRFSPAGEVRAAHGDWRFTLGGVGFSVGDRGWVPDESGQIGSLGFDPGDAMVSSLDFASAQGSVGYRLWHEEKGRTEAGGPRIAAGLQGVGGLRIYDIDFEVRGPSDATSFDDVLGDPFLGATLTLGFVERFTIEVTVLLGYFSTGDDEAFSWDTMVGLAWHPRPYFALEVGYRQLAFDLTSGSGDEEFSWRGAMAGLYAGGSLRF